MTVINKLIFLTILILLASVAVASSDLGYSGQIGSGITHVTITQH